MRYSHVFIAGAFLGVAAFASCSADDTGGDGDDDDGSGSTADEVEGYCAALCDECDNACTDVDDQDDCIDDLKDAIEDVDGCIRDAFVDYLDCLTDDGRCESDANGYYLDDADCYADYESDRADCGGGEGGGGPSTGVAVGPSSASSASTGVGGGTASTGVGGGTSSSSSTSATTTSSTGGCEVTGTSPCADVCECTAGCMGSPPQAEGACATCLQAEIDAGVGSDCATETALGSCCQGDDACADYVDCMIGGGGNCSSQHPAGADRALACGLSVCGNCGAPP